MKKSFLVLMSFLLFQMNAIAQQSNIRVGGTVTDMNGVPMPTVTVQEEGTNNGVLTDFDGNFTIEVNSPQSVLVFSYVGMKIVRQTVDGKTIMNVQMGEDAASLEEVVVVGYGTQLRREVTGSVSQVGGEDIENMPIRSAAEALQGQSAGVMVTSTGGSPGSPPVVRIRGVGTVNNNDPLYVIDGLPQSDIGWLNPNDIASMDILKDASSTSIYGARAANGVIMITTKGSQGGVENNVITFDSYLGFQNPIKTYDMMNASQFMEYKNLAYVNAGLDPFFTEGQQTSVLQFLRANTGSEEGTNWWNEIENKNAKVQNYNLSFSGGSKNLSYRSSLSYMDQEGIIKGSDYERLSWRTNFNHKPKDWLNVSGNIAIINEKRGNVLENSPGFNTAFIAFVTDPISPVYRTNLTDIPDFINDALFLDRIDQNNPWSLYSPILFSNKHNPVAQTDIFNENKWEGIGIKGGGAIDVEIADWLKWRTNIGIDISRGTSDSFTPEYFLDGDQFNSNATVGKSISKNDYYQIENTLSFEKDFGDHKVSALAGISAEEWQGESTGASRQGFVSNDPSQRIISGGSINPQASGTKWGSTLHSYFSRLFYSYDERYMLTANFRYDGSSNFGPDNKWGAFPSLSVGWNFSEESFLEDALWLSIGKLRASWGEIGNQNISRGAYLSTYSGNQGYYLFGSSYVPQLLGGVNYIGNRDIQWEETKQVDIGLDLSFFQNRFSVVLDYYQKTTDGMLLGVPIPSYLGYPNSPWSNAGKVRNSGFESELTYRDQIGDFSYSISANASTVENKVLSLGQGEPISGGGWISSTTTKTEEGMPIGYFYGFKTDGIFQSQAEVDAYIQENARPGDLRFVDFNNDGIINDEDRTHIGDPFPDLTYGLRLGGEYKNFDLQILMQGTIGNEIMNISKIDMKSGVGWYNAPQDLIGEAWSPSNPSNTQFQINANNQNNLQISDWLVEDGSYLRIKNIQVGYTLPDSLLEQAGIQKIRIYAGGYNLFTLTGYSGLDPEIGSGSPLSMGVDQGYYPQASTVMFGINAAF
jgi:TonB-linked SusC/RagA family outer membrane protein